MTEERKVTVGQYLRRERERQNKSLESVAQVTRITLKNLEALEEDNFKTFSAPVFVRGFLRTYAGHLGLDLEEVIRLYEIKMDDSGEPPPSPPSSPVESSRPVIRYLLPVVAIVFAIFIAYGVYEFQKPSTEPSPPSSAGSSAVQQPFGAPPPERASTPKAGRKADLSAKREKAAQTPSAAKAPPKTLPERGKPAGAPAKAGPSPSGEEKKADAREHVLTVKAFEKTWMRIRTGEPPEIDVLLRPNETVTYKTKNSFKIDVGNAGGVELIFNGETRGRPGKSGEVVHLTLPQP